MKELENINILLLESNNEFLKGFNDGLNEGLTSWLKDKTANVVSMGKSMYDKGKQLAGDAWNIIKNSINSGLDKIYNIAKSVTDNYSIAVENILDISNKLIEDMSLHMRQTSSNVYNDVLIEVKNKTISALNSIYNKLPIPDMSIILDTIKMSIDNLTPELVEDISKWLNNKTEEIKNDSIWDNNPNSTRTYVNPKKYQTFNRGVANRWKKNPTDIEPRHFESNTNILSYNDFIESKK